MSVETESVDLVGERVVENVARAAVFAALTGAFAYVAFPNPVSPTDITLQVLGVFLAGVYLGPLWGGVSLTLYLVAGAAGAPVFAGGTAGIGALTGYTGGYLLSYPVAAALTGGIVHGTDGLADPRDVSVVRLVAGMVAGTVVIYAMGTVGFAYVQNVTLSEAFAVSAVAFIPAEAIKIAAAVGVTRSEELNAA
ncbi:biotin transporter BioY [Halobacterium litoreum]|uniref:Biotin transporter BioY n=1 Tax=Halobacterium litoreum TaxID=2039234 RepID=A0ABD5NF19_9EURY|nr:biotin transporter BioY [Halobacterium litoreum]UHH13424.1 biotin transporter BioY [Halobacterium litoreum]